MKNIQFIENGFTFEDNFGITFFNFLCKVTRTISGNFEYRRLEVIKCEESFTKKELVNEGHFLQGDKLRYKIELLHKAQNAISEFCEKNNILNYKL